MSSYTPHEGILGGPCIHCRGTQSEHEGKTCDQVINERNADFREIARNYARCQLTDGSPVPPDGSHTEIEPATGMQRGYVVLSPEERAKGFVKPVRRSYLHQACGVETTMGIAIAETYATSPTFYGATYCVRCRSHFPLKEFNWLPDGEPMDHTLQDAWHEQQKIVHERRAEVQRLARIAEIERELVTLRAKAPSEYADKTP